MKRSTVTHKVLVSERFPTLLNDKTKEVLQLITEKRIDLHEETISLLLEVLLDLRVYTDR